MFQNTLNYLYFFALNADFKAKLHDKNQLP